MRYEEINKKYYHGSYSELPIGTVFKPRGDKYEADWNNTDFYKVLEYYKPKNMLSHKNAVFMVGEENDVDLAGGSTDHVYVVKPLGKIEKHDINWSSEISSLIGDGYTINSPEVKNAAEKYWNGTLHYNENVWEYLTTSAEIIKEIEW